MTGRTLPLSPTYSDCCRPPDVAPRQRPLAERVDLAELTRWNDANAAARLAYRLKPFANRRGVGER